ncbi:MAG TPA: type II toxin-antitoxin system ParD family antitoxin [Isosphaeraceae bacterium]|nr:type II toxin-antitoxin system ParD family antitoxin [Isosphaeraceae bacterium]
MPTRNVNLTDHYDEFVESEVNSGRYQNASEVMRAGLRLLEQRTREDEEKLAVLRELAAEGFDELDRGEAIVLEGEEALADFIGKIGRRAAQRVERGSEGE